MPAFPEDHIDGEDALASNANAVKNISLHADGGIAAEAISVASVPQAVFADSANSGKYTKCDANVSGKLKFDGFTITTAASNGDPVIVQAVGIVPGFTGLTKGAPYYLSDTAGAISSSPGTYRVMVGIAVDTDKILIFKESNRVMAGKLTDLVYTVVSGEGDHDDAVICGFKPRMIELTYVIQGRRSGTGNYEQKKGIAIYIGTTLVFNNLLWESWNTNDNWIPDTTDSTADVRGIFLDNSIDVGQPVAGANGGVSSASVLVSLAVPSIEEYGFTIRRTVDRPTGTPGAATARAKVAWRAFE